MDINKKRYEDFINQKSKIEAEQKEQKQFLKKCKAQNFSKDFYEICEALLIENDKQNMKNLKTYLLSDKFQKFAYERILKFENEENEKPESEKHQSIFDDEESTQEELGLF